MLQQISCAATALDYSYARQSLAATTSTSWYQAVTTRQLVAVDEQALQTYEGLLRLAKVKLAAGQVTQLDVVEACANVNEARNQLLYLQGLLSEEQRNLEVLIGGYPAAKGSKKGDAYSGAVTVKPGVWVYQITPLRLEPTSSR